MEPRLESTGEQCPCGAEWNRVYIDDTLVEVVCGRGHHPIDFLMSSMVSVPAISRLDKERLVSVRGTRSSFIQALIEQAQVQPKPTPIEWRFWHQDQEGKPWQAEEDSEGKERSQDSCQQAAGYEEVQEP